MTRNALAPDLQDLDAWPTVDPSALTEARRKLFNRREQAIRRYVAGQSLVVVEGATGIKRGQLYQLLARCILRHPDGRIHGFSTTVLTTTRFSGRSTGTVRDGQAARQQAPVAAL